MASGTLALQSESSFEYETADPEKQNRLSFRPSDVSDAYQSWFKLNDLASELSSV